MQPAGAGRHRPRVCGTLVSGAYISVDVGHSSVKRRAFTGLEVPPIVTAKNAKEALSPDAPLQNDLTGTLLQLSRAAKSVSALADYLERHPEALIRGKPGDPP
jgi:paraquat-inducible protein B